MSGGGIHARSVGALWGVLGDSFSFKGVVACGDLSAFDGVVACDDLSAVDGVAAVVTVTLNACGGVVGDLNEPASSFTTDGVVMVQAALIKDDLCGVGQVLSLVGDGIATALQTPTEMSLLVMGGPMVTAFSFIVGFAAMAFVKLIEDGVFSSVVEVGDL